MEIINISSIYVVTGGIVNKILMLEDDHGELHTTHVGISSLAVDYFRSILGTEHEGVSTIDQRVCLPTSQILKLQIL